ncbi:MAG TPA: hypothetical protein VG845_01510 [Dehalococcoidia bacterium]|nr:hypothetical protein [Dehalococcoidia bacterium]
MRLRIFGRRALRTFGRHYVTMGSIAIIGVLFALVMSSDSFVSSQRAGVSERAAASATATPVRRNLIQFFVVRDQEQLRTISEAFEADQRGLPDGPRQVDQVVYLIAGTDQEEAATISRLNFEWQLAQGANVDLKVTDVRGRFPRR